MQITTTIDLHLNKRRPAVHTQAVQGDKNSRKLVLRLFDGDTEWPIPSGVSAIVRYSRADGTGGNYDRLADGSAACECIGNTVTVTLAPEVLLVPGPVRVCVGLVREGLEINTFVVIVDVQANPGLEAQGGGYLKIAGSVADAGWEANKYLGTDANGKVVAMAAPVIFGTTDLTPGVSALPTGVLYVVYE